MLKTLNLNVLLREDTLISFLVPELLRSKDWKSDLKDGTGVWIKIN